jgi:hypothetical protein
MLEKIKRGIFRWKTRQLRKIYRKLAKRYARRPALNLEVLEPPADSTDVTFHRQPIGQVKLFWNKAWLGSHDPLDTGPSWGSEDWPSHSHEVSYYRGSHKVKEIKIKFKRPDSEDRRRSTR